MGAVVTPGFVWQKFREGCSLRMPCPQKYSDPLHRLLSALEEEFGCMVGSNVYLTPPRSQGFAPHWDDIEAFLLQVCAYVSVLGKYVLRSRGPKRRVVDVRQLTAHLSLSLNRNHVSIF